MGRPALVDDDGAGCALGQTETSGGQFALKAFAVGRGIPGGQRGGSNVVQGDAGAGFHEPLARRGFRDRGVAFHDAGGQQPSRHLRSALALGAVIAGPCEGGRRRRQAELEADQVANEGSSRVVMVEIHQDAVVPDDAVDAVLVVTAMLRVLRADVGLPLKLELGLEVPPKEVQNRLGIRGLGRRVDVHVIAGLPCRVVSGSGDELPQLGVEIALGDDAAWGDHASDLVGFGLQQVGAQGPAAGAAGAAGDHGAAPRQSSTRCSVTMRASRSPCGRPGKM